MGAILIFWPGLVTALLDKPASFDPAKVHIEVPSDEDSPERYFEQQERGQR